MNSFLLGLLCGIAARHYCYPVEGQKAGEASFHRRQAIRLGGI